MKKAEKSTRYLRNDLDNVNICEWCGMTYPIDCYTYWRVVVFNKKHEICDDCYKHLRKV